MNCMQRKRKKVLRKRSVASRQRCKTTTTNSNSTWSTKNQRKNAVQLSRNNESWQYACSSISLVLAQKAQHPNSDKELTCIFCCFNCCNSPTMGKTMITTATINTHKTANTTWNNHPFIRILSLLIVSTRKLINPVNSTVNLIASQLLR